MCQVIIIIPIFYDDVTAIDLNDGDYDNDIDTHTFAEIADIIEKNL